MIDNLRHQGLRLKLAEVLREKGIKDEKVLMAISKIPRHLFIDKAFIELPTKIRPFLSVQVRLFLIHIR